MVPSWPSAAKQKSQFLRHFALAKLYVLVPSHHPERVMSGFCIILRLVKDWPVVSWLGQISRHSRPLRVDRIALSLSLYAGTFWRATPSLKVFNECRTISPYIEQVWTHISLISWYFLTFLIYFWTEIRYHVLVQGSENAGKWWNFHPHTYFQFGKVWVEYFSG
jgi:hypothetical protein